MDTLADLDRIKGRTRTALRSFWYPLVVVGALILGAGALYAFAPRGVVGTYWVVGYVAAFLAVARYYALRARRVGVRGDTRAYAAAWVGFVVGASVVATIAANTGGATAASVAASVAIGVFYLWLARMQRSVFLAAVGIVVAAYGCVLAWAEPAHAEAIWCFGAGAILVGSGLYAREHDAAE